MGARAQEQRVHADGCRVPGEQSADTHVSSLMCIYDHHVTRNTDGLVAESRWAARGDWLASLS